ncbi:hypothetical protein SAMN04488504_112163 [Myxococcus virescens]|uniref:Uncharacterized protein n=1 Tax=Myxococcus virescens TaxID=83456 RepID=A0ABY0N1P8_9BACT|nr:hypothetical protein SAMN04488504_112163 [Myxococcus virescens]
MFLLEQSAYSDKFGLPGVCKGIGWRLIRGGRYGRGESRND